MDDLAESMVFCSINNHNRTIIHIDIDCFYAQVEMLKNPALRQYPLGIQQKNIIVTSNYLAREYGIQKCMLITEGLRLCPQLVLVSGEDLQDYRQMSSKITNLLHKYSSQVEKLGLDENFVDVTHLISGRLENEKQIQFVGQIYGDSEEKCDCGCKKRLCIGSIIAAEIRKDIADEIGITSCAGIAHNKLLAKLVCTTHKPNQQTTVLPCNSLTLLSSLQNVKGIPGIGYRMFETLQCHGISSVSDLRNCNLILLKKILGDDNAIHIKKLSYGIDDSIVKQTGKPQSIGLEDGFRKICFESEVKEKLLTLLHRLLKLLSQDDRIPGSVRVTVRKYDNSKKLSHRESRQCNLPISLFKNFSSENNKYLIAPKSIEKVMGSVMQLFHKMVDITKPFHLTLLGLAFTKFQERKTGKNSIVSFLTNDISVQSLLNLKSSILEPEKIEDSSECSSLQFNIEKIGSETEQEPSPKKSRMDLINRTKKRLKSEENESSPIKRLFEKHNCNVPVCSFECKGNFDISNSNIEQNIDKYTNIGESTTSNSNSVTFYPKNVDKDVFNALPQELKTELMDAWKSEKKEESVPTQVKNTTSCTTSKQKTILQYFIKNK